ncbi:hypothetical protein PACTADRAFT_49715 [Pachysolen tannophilus NRRL Y-2460]|uniref:Nuclear pore protein n=1 Tax=Pachysolen tannophilus NRRL Y-2460 TaxID=669874 RepID=A0A1E4TX71_PACTA|nr:hypothetical protein PACTADRAFT_49715 [Pachysolen tannophilus NRRL Y-2460]
MTVGNESNDFATNRTGKYLLKELIESARHLPKRYNDLGTIQLGLNDIQKKASESIKDKDKLRHYTKAHYLLTLSGITAEEIENDLKSLEVHPSLDAFNPTVSPLINWNEANIKTKKDGNILMAIEHSLSSAAKDFDNFVNQNISMDWKQRKNELRESFQLILFQKDSATALPPSAQSPATAAPSPVAASASSPFPENKKHKASPGITWKSVDKNKNSLLNRGEFTDVKAPVTPEDNLLNPGISFAARQKFEIYAQVIHDLNKNRQNRISYPIALVFADLTKENTDTKSKQVHHAWRILHDFVISNDDRTYQERKFLKSYTSTDLNDFNALTLRKSIVKASRKYLENQFVHYINEIYRKSDPSINRISLPRQKNQDKQKKQPTNIEKIKVLLDKKLKINGKWKLTNLITINSMPIWAMIFYLLRAGWYEDALTLTEENIENFHKFEKSFPVYLRSYINSPERKLPEELHERLHAEFNQYFKHLNKETDPFKYAIYKIIGRCDLTRKNLPYITLSVEDWLWTHLTLTKEDNIENDPIHERYTILDLQKTIEQLGPDNFNNSNNNPLYLQALMLSGSYELAVQYLYSSNEVNAVHLAISLSYYGLLRVTKTVVDSLIAVNDFGQRELNFSGLLIAYTRTFKISDPRIAVEYLTLICMTGGNDQERKQEQEICLEYLRKLILETREFKLLLGEIKKNGVRVPGFIEEKKKLLLLEGENDYLQKVTEQAAIRADEEGRTDDSILLHQLSGEYNIVINLVNTLLGELLNITELDKPLRSPLGSTQEDIVSVAERLMESYSTNAEVSLKIELKKKETCSKLLYIVKIRGFFVNQDWERCLKYLGALDFIPASLYKTDLNKLREMAQNVQSLDDSIARNISSLLIMTMTCVSQLTYSLVHSEYRGQTKDERLQQLKQISKNCMIFAGLVEYKMPQEIYTMLINLESLT